jgi:hypothetical protein
MPTIKPSLGLRAKRSLVLPVTFAYDREPFAQLAGAYATLNTLGDTMAARRQELESDRRLTPHGRKESLAEFVRGPGVAALKQATEALDLAADRAKAIADSMTLPGYDKSDIAAAMVRSEIRTHLRSLPAEKKASMLVLGIADEMTLHAVLEAPAHLSGLSDRIRDEVRHTALVKAHPEKAAQLEEIDNASRVLKTALQAAAAVAMDGNAVPPLELDGLVGGRKKLSVLAREEIHFPIPDSDEPAMAAE